MKKAMVITLAVLGLLSVAALGVYVKYFCGYEIYRDLEYGESERSKLDLYLPEEAYERETNGVVLFIHGGSWSGGDKSEEELRCRLIASEGYIAAAMNYTLARGEDREEYTVDTVLMEISEALGAVVSYTAELGITVDKAATAGYSAGAHLSMLYSFSSRDTAPVEILFTANMAGPADLTPEIWREEMAIRIGSLLSGKEITAEMIDNGESEEILASVSPVFYVSENTPPTILIYGVKDALVTKENCESLVKKFESVGVPYDLFLLPDSDHSLLQNPIKHLKYYQKIIEYCKEYFA